MKTLRTITTALTVTLLLVIAPTSCSMIDDDRSDCEADFFVRYEVTLHTNLTTQVQTVLRSRFETAVANLLEDSLKTIFREFAHDVDLSFYIDNDRRFHDRHIMDAGQATYDLELPADNYRHLALANMVVEPSVELANSEHADQSYINQLKADTIHSHNIGLFSARQDMNIVGNVDQMFDVTLYMVNCASILVVRTDNVLYRDLQVYSTDFADGFMINDSVYLHRHNPLVHDVRVTNPPVDREVFYSVSFPSCDTAEEAQKQTRLEVGSNDSQTGADDSERIWRKYVYATMPDGSITRTTINVRKPLEAGQVMIIYAYLKPDGSIYSPNVEVGTSVQLNWKGGLIFN
jgi:hypothetical protein